MLGGELGSRAFRRDYGGKDKAFKNADSQGNSAGTTPSQVSAAKDGLTSFLRYQERT